jgi:D-threo-aldose 1-dehydrogenase
MYGLGMAEAEVGRFARGREDVTIATKFGIEPPAPHVARLQAPARAAMAAVPALKDRLKSASRNGPRERRRYDARLARASLEISLRELGRERVELFCVHDPGRGDEVDVDGLAALAEELIGRGLIGAWGISGDADPCVALATATRPAAVLQLRDEVFAPVTASDGRPFISFGVLSAAVGRVAHHLEEPPRRRRWCEEIGVDCGRPEVLASLLLQDALARNREGGVLFATTKPLRLRGAVASAAAVERQAEPSTLAAFRRLLVAELDAPEAPDA